MISGKNVKRLAVGCGLSIAFAGVAVVALVWSMGQPMYRVGSVSAEKNLRHPLTPPEQSGGLGWQVAPDIRLHFESHGKGRPVLVLHGGPGVPYTRPWAGLDSLGERFQFHYYHQRGCGQSTRPFDAFESPNYYGNMTQLEQTLGIGAQLADIERIRQILGQEKMIVIGHSFGGFLASLYAAEFPDRVEKLVLVAPAGVLVLPDAKGDFFERTRENLPPDQHAEYDVFRSEYFDFGNIFSKSEADLTALNKRGGQYFLTAMGETIETSADDPVNGGWMVYAMYFSMGQSHDYRPPLKQVTAPVLILHGKDDTFALHGSRMYESCFPNARFELLGLDPQDDVADGRTARRAGHFIFNDCPQGFARTVADFLND